MSASVAVRSRLRTWFGGWLLCGGFLLACQSKTTGASAEPELVAPPPTASPTPVRAEPSSSTPAQSSSSAEGKSVLDRRAPAWLPDGGEGSAQSEHGVVTSVETNATQAGVAILEQGGNAIDAAVAVGYALAVTHPSAGNLGGGGFLLVSVPGRDTLALDFRERAPLATTTSAFERMLKQDARGPLASGVPGTVAGLNEAHQKFGRLPLATVMAPAIALAREGHRLGQRQAATIRWAWRDLRRDRAARSIFGNGAQPKPAGTRVVQPKLAATLQRIAEQGSDGFYRGDVAKAIERYMVEHGGLIREQDLTEYRAVWRTPLRTEYRNVTVEVMSPPSAGGVAVVAMLAMLEKLEAFRLSRESTKAVHLFAEVAKRAHTERRFHVVDPDSVERYDAPARLAHWQDADHFLSKFPIVNDRATPASRLHLLYEAAVKELEHTTHFSVADRDGMLVSCTTTLSAGFGARYVIGDLGVVMNNSWAAFGTVGEDVPAPGRRMTSSMSPTLVWAGETPILVLGSPGGDTIPNTVVQVLRNVVDYHLPLSEAVLAPRVHHGFVPDEIRYERAYPPSPQVLRELRGFGHKVSAPRRVIGDANNLLVHGHQVFGFADPREGGLALGATPSAGDP